MKRTEKLLSVALLAVALTALSLATGWAQGSGSKEKTMKVNVGGELQTVTSNGTKSFVLKVAQATDDQGNKLADLSGQTFKLVADAKTRALAAKHSAGSKLLVKGTLNATEKILAVATYKADDGKGSDTK